MRYLNYLYIVVSLILVASCARMENEMISGNIDANKSLMVVGRVMPMSEMTVSTRADEDEITKEEDETNILSLDLAIFDNEGKCIYYSHVDQSNPVFVLERKILADLYNLSDATFYVFGNTDIFKNKNTTDPWIGKGIDDFISLSCDVSGIINLPDYKGGKAFPLIGSCEKVNMETETVTVNGQPVVQVAVNLKSLYAKFVVNIEVQPDQIIEDNFPPQFELTGWEVHNVVKTVGFDSDDNVENISDGKEVYDEVVFTGERGIGEIASSTRTASFYFYLPERFLTPQYSADNYNYPFMQDNGSIRDEDKIHRQKYKPCLVENQNATFVRFKGTYLDHQNHLYDISYDIYVGEDEYSNFDVERNTQYNNNIIIKGAKKSVDGAQNEERVSIDHRVNISRTNPIIISLERETLLDSHFEVRPLRIRKQAVFEGDVYVKVEVDYDKEPEQGNNWVGLERSFGNGVAVNDSQTYLVSGELSNGRKNAAGKRKYFTTDLTTSTLGTRIENIPISDNGECVWIYVDEAKESDASDAMRSATIKVSYSLDGGNTYGESINYIIRQHELFPVQYSGRKYLIEYHEEYLHNYDAEDSFGQTEYEGIQWGLDGAQLSFDHSAIYIKPGGLDAITTPLKSAINAVSPFYDFYLTRDTDNSDAVKHERAGFDFCKEIINDINNPQRDTETDYTVDILSLGEDPRSAIEYCYNKNKRNAAGQVVYQNDDGTWNFDNLVWYLPAIDEMEEIIMSKYNVNYYTYSKFPDFQAKYYWSSQPAYFHNYVWVNRSLGHRVGAYMYDNIEYARATSVSYNGNGADNASNYLKISSDMSGYNYVMECSVGGSSFSGYTVSIKEYHNTPFEFNYWNNDDGSMFNQIYVYVDVPSYSSGYKRRTDYARVRCVRKVN